MIIWKDITGYEGRYQVNNIGQVKSLVSNKILQHSYSVGYPMVSLSKNGKGKSFKIHQLMAVEFLGHKPNGSTIVVDHINNDRTDNRIENLQLITHRTNGTKDQKNGSSQYTGVAWDNYAQKWKSQIRINGRSKHLGSFKCELPAASAYQKALKAL